MSDRFLEGKFAVVTGGTRGIGRAIAARLIEEGAAVAICGRTEAPVKAAVAELAKHGEAAGFAADLSKLEDARRFFEFAGARFPGIDILVNNAGTGCFAPLDVLTPEQWHSMIDLNLSGVFYCCHFAIPLMKKRGGGHIVNISSLAGKNPFAGGAGYNASKFGLNGMSEAGMMDLRYQNIRVSYVMPGSVDTEFGGTAAPSDWKIAPEDIAEIVSNLLHMPDRTLVSRVEVRPSRPKK